MAYTQDVYYYASDKVFTTLSNDHPYTVLDISIDRITALNGTTYHIKNSSSNTNIITRITVPNGNKYNVIESTSSSSSKIDKITTPNGVTCNLKTTT